MYASLLTISVVLVSGAVFELLKPGADLSLPLTVDQQQGTRDFPRALLILFIWWGPMLTTLVLPRKEPTINSWKERDMKSNEEIIVTALDSPPSTISKISVDERTPLTRTSPPHDPKRFYVTQSTRSRDSVSNLTLVEMLKTPSAWLMLWTTAILVGSGTTLTNNM